MGNCKSFGVLWEIVRVLWEIVRVLVFWGSVVILDQHRAHHAIRVRELFKELQCQLVFLPIETLWSTTKRQFRKRLIEHEPAHMSQAWMRSELSRILARFDEEKLENHARSHYCEVIHARVERAY